jgi:hypothetical protein
MYHPQVVMVMTMMIVEQSMECELAGEAEVLRENLLQCHFFSSSGDTVPIWAFAYLHEIRRFTSAY